VKQHIGLVVLEHLSDQLDIHILNVDFLPHGLAIPLILTQSKQFDEPVGSYSEA